MNDTPEHATVFVVDDDEAIRDSIGWLLTARKMTWQGFASAEEFLTYSIDHPQLAGCLLLDIRMGGMSGLQLFDLLCERESPLPTIFLTGHGDVPMAVAALKKGAFDFVEKPFNADELIQRLQQALEQDANQRNARAGAASVQGKLAQLSVRERQVMDCILAGKLNKVIADELGISMRTVEVHRARVFDKMGVRTAVELAQLLRGIA
jgi:two-component system response regulator DctR